MASHGIRRVGGGLIDAYREIAPGTLGHFTNLRFMDSGIHPVFPDCRLVGPAVTVWAPAGSDQGILAQAEELMQPGDVLVVDRGGDTEHACFGEFRALRGLERQVAGWVLDGAVCDVRALRALRFPVFCRAVTPRVAQPLNVEGAVNVPVSCGGVVVLPGELIVADDDGVAVLSAAEAQRQLDESMAKEADERRRRAAHRDRYGAGWETRA